MNVLIHRSNINTDHQLSSPPLQERLSAGGEVCGGLTSYRSLVGSCGGSMMVYTHALAYSHDSEDSTSSERDRIYIEYINGYNINNLCEDSSGYLVYPVFEINTGN